MAYKEIYLYYSYIYMCVCVYIYIYTHTAHTDTHTAHATWRPAHVIDVNRQHFHLTQVIHIDIINYTTYSLIVDSQAVICLEEDRIRQMTTRSCIPAAGCPRSLTLMAYAVQQPSVGSHLALRALRPHRSGSVCARPRRF